MPIFLENTRVSEEWLDKFQFSKQFDIAKG